MEQQNNPNPPPTQTSCPFTPRNRPEFQPPKRDTDLERMPFQASLKHKPLKKPIRLNKQSGKTLVLNTAAKSQHKYLDAK